MPETLLVKLCRLAGLQPDKPAPRADAPPADSLNLDFDRDALAQRLVERRRQTGMTQVELARRAGIRIETLNRVERARTTPDFATIRKLVVALREAEAALAPLPFSTDAPGKEKSYVRRPRPRPDR